MNGWPTGAKRVKFEITTETYGRMPYPFTELFNHIDNRTNTRFITLNHHSYEFLHTDFQDTLLAVNHLSALGYSINTVVTY
mgnify:CR=1 FL=1